MQNDPVNFVDPSGLNRAGPGTRCVWEGYWVGHVEGGGDWDIRQVCFGESDDWGRIGFGGFGSGIPQNPQPLPTDLKDRVANIVNNPNTDCAEFIKKLIGNLKGNAFSDDPMKLFERVENERGFRLGNTGKYAGLAGITSGKREVKIRPVGSTADPRL